MRIHSIGFAVIALILLAGSVYYVLPATGVEPQTVVVAQTQTITQAYCCYQVSFLVVEVEVSPKTTEAGTSVRIELKVEYLDGSPVSLRPELADFLLVGAAYSHTYSRVPLTPLGAGKYSASITLWADIPAGTYKLYCVHCTLSDGQGNFSPNTDTSSDETVIPIDLSIFSIGPATTTTTAQPPPTGLPLSLLVESAILVLLILIAALLALLLRRRKK